MSDKKEKKSIGYCIVVILKIIWGIIWPWYQYKKRKETEERLRQLDIILEDMKKVHKVEKKIEDAQDEVKVEEEKKEVAPDDVLDAKDWNKDK